MLTAHGAFPLYRDPSVLNQDLTHFGHSFKMSMPLITIAAKLLYFSRREIVPFNVPDHLPVNRAHAIQLGLYDVGPTQEDVIEFNTHTDTKFPRRTTWDWWEDLTEDELDMEFDGLSSAALKSASSKWDNDWMRLSYCSNPWIDTPCKGVVYTPGMFTGLWQGRMIVRLFLNSLIIQSSLHFLTDPERDRIFATCIDSRLSCYVLREPPACFDCPNLHATPRTPLH